ncbi:MAG: hypothetical protein U9O41_08880 [Candidatus Aerophobetes bacterium]|nr:hypothetical protein [Candidatus Aerophobetes bacterium]
MKKIAVSIIVLVAIGVGVFLIISYREPAPEALSPEKESELLTGQATPELAEIGKIKRDIITEVEDRIVKYQEDFLYSEDDFSVILENEDEFKSQLIEKFKKEIIGVEALNCKVDLDDFKKSAALKCNVKGARYSTNSYNMHFLLGNWPFDLMNFKQFEKKLTWEGEIDDIPTSIVFEFPYTLSHCHEHVWPK